MKYLFSKLSVHLTFISESLTNLMEEICGILVATLKLVELIFIPCLTVFTVANPIEYLLMGLSISSFGVLAYVKHSIILWILLALYPILYLFVGALWYKQMPSKYVRNALLIAALSFVMMGMLIPLIGVLS